MIKIKTLSFFQRNPQNTDKIPNFWNSFKQLTQQFLCTIDSYLKRPKPKKRKKKQRNRHRSPHAVVIQIKGLNKIQKHKNKTKSLRWYPPKGLPRNHNVTEPPAQLSHSPIICNTNTRDMAFHMVQMRIK